MAESVTLTNSQSKTMELLRGADRWWTAKEIQRFGGSCASLPRLIQLGMVKELLRLDWETTPRAWRAVNAIEE